MCNTIGQFRELERVEAGRKVILGNSTSSKVSRIGSIDLELRASEDRHTSITLTNVLLVPKLRRNLLSVSCLMEDGIDVHFNSKENTCEFLRNNEIVGRAFKSKNLWVLDTISEERVDISAHSMECPEVNLASSKTGIDLWHLRFNHLNEDELHRMHRNQVVRGLDIHGGNSVKGHCTGCALGKQHREKLVSVEERRQTEPLGLVHSDVVGPMEVESIQTGKRWVLTFIDDCTRRSWVYLMRTKDEVFHWFQIWKAMVELQSGHKVKILRSDNGGEYVSTEMRGWLATQGIEQQFSNADTPQQNGVAERFNRTMVEAVRSMLQGAGLSKGFWGEATLCFNHTRNRTPTKGLTGGITPMEAWSGVKPSVYHLRPFGCKVSVHISERKRRKLDPKSFSGIFLGYSLEKKGYRVWDNNAVHIVDSRDVIFYEESLLKRNLDHSGHIGIEEEDEVPMSTESVPRSEKLNEPEFVELGLSESPRAKGGSSRRAVQEPPLAQEHGKELAVVRTQVPWSDREQLHEGGSLDQTHAEVQGQLSDETEIEHGASEFPESSSRMEHESPLVPESSEVVPRTSDPRETLARNVEVIQLESDSETHEESESRVEPTRRSTRVHRRPMRLAYDKLGIPSVKEVGEEDEAEVNHACCYHAASTEPQSYMEAMRTSESHQWRGAIEKELESLRKNGTYTVEPLPKGRKAVKCKWVFKLKRLLDGSVKFKARLVAKGFLQKEGVDYKETFAPVVKYKSLRMLLSMACERNMEVHQMDVTTAFLNGDLEETIYMEPPEGLSKPEEKGKVEASAKSLWTQTSASLLEHEDSWLLGEYWFPQKCK